MRARDAYSELPSFSFLQIRLREQEQPCDCILLTSRASPSRYPPNSVGELSIVNAISVSQLTCSCNGYQSKETIHPFIGRPIIIIEMFLEDEIPSKTTDSPPDPGYPTCLRHRLRDYWF